MFSTHLKLRNELIKATELQYFDGISEITFHKLAPVMLKLYDALSSLTMVFHLFDFRASCFCFFTHNMELLLSNPYQEQLL